MPQISAASFYNPYFFFIYAKNPSISTAASSGILPTVSQDGSFAWDIPSSALRKVTFSRFKSKSPKSVTLQKLSNKGFISPDEFRIQSEALAAQRQRLTAQRNKKLHGLQSHSAMEKLEELQAILSSWPGVPTEFDIDQFDEIVEKIIPTADNKLTFRLHCGLELTEDIPS